MEGKTHIEELNEIGMAQIIMSGTHTNPPLGESFNTITKLII